MPNDFPIIASKTAMLFFDTLNGSLHPNDPASQAAIDASGYIGKLEKLNRACREAGITVFYTRPEHRPDLRDWPRTIIDAGHHDDAGRGPRWSADPGSVAGSRAAQVIDEIAPQQGDYVITNTVGAHFTRPTWS